MPAVLQTPQSSSSAEHTMSHAATLLNRAFAPGDRVEVVSGELAGRRGDVLLPGSGEVLVRLAAGDRWPDLNVAGLHPDALRLVRTRPRHADPSQFPLESER